MSTYFYLVRINILFLLKHFLLFRGEVLSTRKRGNRTRGLPSPIVLLRSPLPHCWVRLTPDHHLYNPVASLTSRSICCSHHQRCGTAPLFRSPCLHSFRIGWVAMYTVIICRQTVMYSASVLILQHVLRLWVNPPMSWSPPWVMPHRHPLGCTDVEPILDLPERSSRGPTFRCR